MGAELFGAEYHDIRAFGPAAFGNNNIVAENFHEAAKPARPHVGELDYAGDLLATHAPTDSDALLRGLLVDRRAVCLTGPAGSGRFSSAVTALVDQYGPQGVHEIFLAAGSGLAALEHHPDVLVEAAGHILRVDRISPSEVLGFLAATARKRSARILLIREADTRSGETHGGEVRHVRPEPVLVFIQHLTALLRITKAFGPEGEDQILSYVTAVSRSDDLGRAIGRARRPKEIVAVAAAVAAQLPDPDDLAEVLASSQPRRRELAHQVLNCPQRPGILHPHHLNQHERAFRIAYTVFYSRPVNYVFEATGWLLEEMDGQAARAGWRRPVLEHAVADLLGNALAADWHDGSAVVAETGSRTAVLRDPGLRGAILDVAWHEFDNSRPALLSWLNRLAGGEDLVMQEAAAEIAGFLAHFDFDLVFGRLVDEWAASPRVSVRQVAAWAAATAILGGKVGHRVLRRVRDWSHGAMARQHDTAARLYASGMRQPTLEWTLADLRRIAEDRLQRGSWVIAEAFSQLFEYADADILVRELARWSEGRTGTLQNHAARAMLAAAVRPAPDQPAQPHLLRLLADGEIQATDVTSLWRTALLDPALAGRGWSVLTGWLRAADEDGSLRPPLQDLVHFYVDDPVMRRRLEFYLRDRLGSDGVRWTDTMTGVLS